MTRTPASRLALTLAAAAAIAWSWAFPLAAQPPAPTAGAPPALKSGDTGTSVESLQRRLNARLVPPPGLDVDGDFGAATRAALVRFQTSRKLRPSGVADPETWTALGPDPGTGPEPPPPAQVNARPSPRKPADPLDGPPFVTAKAWAVLDGTSGELLGGHEAETPLEMASTTKIMTALVVLRAARSEPGLLDERVTFSERADRTTGSTSGVKAGESLPLRELLYGLLLPSGNDASVALAEHVGGRFAPASSGGKDDALSRFVAEMNRVAVELGLRQTRFANTHGLPAADHAASARDLARLAMVAMKEPVFAACVNTPRHGSVLSDGKGGTRNVVWTNTNRLLDTEGYDGIKTGTTTAAGMCLVASGRREGRRLIVVVLGSTSTEARYAEARNLFRWGWRRLGLGAARAASEPTARPTVPGESR